MQVSTCIVHWSLHHSALMLFCHALLIIIYWLLGIYRINFKICCITYRAFSLHDLCYLRFVFSRIFKPYSFRFSSFNSLLLFYLKNLITFVLLLKDASDVWSKLRNNVRSASTYIKLTFRKN